MASLAESLAERTLQLCRVRSQTGDEAAICAQLEGWARGRWPDATRRIGNSLVVGQPRPDRPTLALVAHLDTVPFFAGDGEPRIDGQRLVGKGASDMKGGLAVALALAEALPASVPDALLLVLYEREEGPYTENGLEALFAAGAIPRVDLAICLEPTANALQLGCVGSLHATVRFRGQTAHSARPWEGRNAVHAAAGLLSRLASLPPREVERDGLVFREVTSITQANGGRARNVVPDLFELNLNHRFAPGKSLAEAQREVRELVGEGAEIEFTDLSPSGPLCLKNAVVQRFRGLTARSRGQTGLDGRRALRRSWHRRGQFWPGRSGTGTPGRRVGRHPGSGGGLRYSLEAIDASRLRHRLGMRAFLGLGGNLGDPPAQFVQALALLDKVGVKTVRRSSLYRSPPLGPPQPDYVNAVVEIETGLGPSDLLIEILAAERRLGRERDQRWGPRLVDIDILLFGATSISGPGLTIPHPGLTARAFVLVPLSEARTQRRAPGSEPDHRCVSGEAAFGGARRDPQIGQGLARGLISAPTMPPFLAAALALAPILTASALAQADSVEQSGLPPGHPPIGQLPPGHPTVDAEEMDGKKLLEKLDAMRDQLKDRPKTAEIEYALGNLYYENARYPEAIDYYRQLLERSAAPLLRYMAARSHPHKAVGPEQAGCPPSARPAFDQLIAIADTKAAAHDYSAAVTCYQAALLPVIVAKTRRANAFFLIGNPDRAVQEHREALAIEPDFLDSLFFLGAILYETGDGDVAKLTQAADAWKKFLASGPDPDRSKLVKENLGRIDRALVNGGHIPSEPGPPEPGSGPGPIEPPPPPPELTPKQRHELELAVAEGERRNAKRDWTRSLAAFEKARKLDRADPRAATGAGIALLQLGKRLESEAAFRDALGRDPKNGQALYELGEVFFENEHFAGAARFWNQLLDRDPKTAAKYDVKARLAEAQAKQSR